MWTQEQLQRLVQSQLGDRRLVVVSNRQPYIYDLVDGEPRCTVPAGGVTSAIDPLMQACNGTWIAHGAGNADPLVVDQHNKVLVPPDAPTYAQRMIWLTEEEERHYYSGFSNEALWPLCHNAHVEPKFDSHDWETYKAVNQKFAQAVLKEIAGRPAVVFAQDYHLALLSRFLRDVKFDIIIGQFWHIPWPSPEIFRICPWQQELLDGLLGNDLLGFHTGNYRNNFMDTVAHNLEANVDRNQGRINYQGGTTLVKPFPISIDFEQICQEAQSQEVGEEMERLTDELSLGDKLVGLGIDRIDYTKGIPNRFQAISRFLEKNPDYHEKFLFIQAGVMSRTDIDSYQRLSEQIETLLGEINGRFSRNGWEPIIYMPTDLPHVTLMALRRLARFSIVSSLNDGMNLVAKEYVASRFDEDGVLILSPFTGAAQELVDALIVNPYSVEQFADAIWQALVMPYEERRSRMVKMRGIVRENNIYKWAAGFINDLVQHSEKNDRV